MTTQVTKKVNGTDFLAPKHHIKNTQSCPGGQSFEGELVAQVTGHDWLEAVSASRFLPEALSSLSSPAASPAAVLWQEAGSVQACQCPVLCPSNDTNCSLLTAEEQKKYPTTQKRRFLAVLLHPLFEPCSSPLPCLVSHWQQDSYAVTIEMWCGRLEQQLYILRRGDWGTLLWLTCLSAAVWASVLPLWHFSLSSQQRANTKPLRAAKM